MADEKDLPIKVDIGLKAELKGEIPTEKVGNAVDAILDTFSPFTQGMGLIGDHLRFHREKVIIKIGGLAREKAATEGLKIKPVPLKFMVPFLEKASCEDLESELLEVWANLLKTASTDYSENFIPFINVLSLIGPREVLLLKEMIEPSLYLFPKPAAEVHSFLLTKFGIEFPWDIIPPDLIDGVKFGNNEETFNSFKAIFKTFYKQGKSQQIYSLTYPKDGGVRTHQYAESNRRHSFDVLIHLNLLFMSKEVPPFEGDFGMLEIDFVKPTPFGCKLVIACSDKEVFENKRF